LEKRRRASVAKDHNDGSDDAQTRDRHERNGKAFAVFSSVKAHRQQLAKLELESKRHHAPVMDRIPVDVMPAPYVVAVVGHPKSAKRQ
jgi:hypothetical protein